MNSNELMNKVVNATTRGNERDKAIILKVVQKAYDRMYISFNMYSVFSRKLGFSGMLN